MKSSGAHGRVHRLEHFKTKSLQKSLHWVQKEGGEGVRRNDMYYKRGDQGSKQGIFKRGGQSNNSEGNEDQAKKEGEGMSSVGRKWH